MAPIDSKTLELLTRPRMNNRRGRPGPLAFLGINSGERLSTTDPRAPGVDISNWNVDIDWPEVGQSIPSLAYCFIKATESTFYTSRLWRAQWDGAGLLGIPRSSYHFWRGNTPGAAQAAWFLAHSSAGELPDVLDVEDGDNVPQQLSITQRLAYAGNIRAFLDAIYNARQKPMIIYTGSWFWNRLGELSWASDYPGWFATYRPLDDTGPIVPLGWDAWDLWQYSSRGEIEGFPDFVDKDVFRGNRAEFKTWAGIKDYRVYVPYVEAA